MIGKMLTRTIIVGFLAVCLLLQVGLAGGDNGTYQRNLTKINVPLEIELFFSSTPMLNEYTVLNVEIRALKEAPNTLIEIEVPQEGFEIISGSTQFNEDLDAGSTNTYQLEILAAAPGKYKIAASATSEETDYIFGKREELYVNIGEEFSELSKSSFIPEITDTRSEAVKIENVSVPPTQVLPNLKPGDGQEVSYYAAPGTGQIQVRGYWFYQDKSGIDRPLRDARVEIWDSDSSGDTLLDTTSTGNSGYYESGNISNSDDEGGGQDIYVKVYSTDNRSVRVTDVSTPGNLYSAVTEVQTNVIDGEVDMGSYSLKDAENRMAWYIYDLIANDAFDYLANTVGWQNVYNLQVKWSPTNTSIGTGYQPGGSITLLAADRWDSDVFLHEYGHFVMYKIYGNDMPPAPGCSNHYWGGHFGLGCAWVEGWANFLQAAIQNDPNYVDTEDQYLHMNFEPPIPSASHAEDEGAVAASLWDIFDPASASESWDTMGNGINGSSNNGIWSIVYNGGPADIFEFYLDWINSSNGYNSEITAILQHHKIDPDTTRPTVTITAPTSGSTYSTGSSQLNIGGTASDNRAVTSVSWSNNRGGSGACSGTNTWSKSGIALSSGQNVITVTARDAAGNTATDTLTVTYTPPDTSRPTISITSPTSSSSYSTDNFKLNISGTASDNAEVSTVSWTNSQGGSGICSGTSTWNKNDILLASGQNVITVTARDAAGNTATDTLTVTYTPPDNTDTDRPTVSITTPTGDSTYATGNSQLSIGGTASDNETVALVSWTNSRGSSGNCNGTNTWSTSDILLSSGQNVITVMARDAAGNTATDTLTVNYTPPDTIPPTVTIATPTSESTYFAGSSQLSIGGTASDNVEVTTVSWINSRGGSGTCSGTNTWSTSDIFLSNGQNIITVTARDAAGNTTSDTLSVTYTSPDTPPEIVEEDSYPHDAQGLDEGTIRVPNDTSIVVRIKNENGIDQDSLEMRIENQFAGLKVEKQSVGIRVQEVNDGDDTDFWLIHSPETPFAYGQTVNLEVDAKSLNGVEMDTYYSSFKIESEEEHDAALVNTPFSTEYSDEPVIGQNTIVADPETAIEGAKIIYDILEPVAPRFGPLEEIPDLDIVMGVGFPLNMQPANVFVNPVTVFIPCPGETDLETLEIYVFNPAVGWKASWETDGCIVPGSRVNHGPNDPEPTEPPTIEIQLNHFSGVQAGKPAVLISPSTGTGNVEKAGGGGGGGGGCFIASAAGGLTKPKIDPLKLMLLLALGFAGYVGIRRKLKK